MRRYLCPVLPFQVRLGEVQGKDKTLFFQTNEWVVLYEVECRSPSDPF